MSSEICLNKSHDKDKKRSIYCVDTKFKLYEPDEIHWNESDKYTSFFLSLGTMINL